MSEHDQAFEEALRAQLDGADAAVPLEKALALRDAAFGQSSPQALEVLLTLISEHARQKRPEAARKSLDDLIGRGAPGAEAMAGAFHSSFGDWARAEAHYARALAQAPAQGEERAKLLHAVGRARLELGRLAEGQETLAEAVREGSAAAAVDLSDALAAQGKVDEARDVLELARRGADQRWAVECTSRLGALYRAGGDFPRAESLARETVMSAEELDARAAALALFELAAVQAQMGKNSEALTVLQRAHQALANMEPRDDYAVAQAQLRLGCQLLYGFALREAEAVPLLHRSLGALTRIAGPESPECAEVLVHLAVAALRRQDVSTAEGLAARSAAIYERAFGPGNRFAAGPLNLLGAIRLQLGDEAGAKQALARAGGTNLLRP